MPTEAEVYEAVQQARSSLLQRQTPAGCWIGKIYFSAWSTAYSLLFHRHLGISDRQEEQRAVRWLLDCQNQDGSWGIIERESEGSTYITCAVMLALKVAGVPENSVAIAKAEQWLRARYPFSPTGGTEASDPLTQVLYALFGELGWNRVFLPPIQVFLLPEFIRGSMPPWWENTVRGLSIVVTLNKYPRLSLLQRIAIRKTERWILKNQYPNGSWFGTVGRTICNVLGLFEVGYPTESKVIRRALEFIKGRQEDDGTYFRQRRFDIRVWNTELAILALVEAVGGVTSSAPPVIKAGKWLLDAQDPRGGWSFIPKGLYLDVDDAAMGLCALKEIDFADRELIGRKKEAIRKAERWLSNMQNEDGGWPTYVKGQEISIPGSEPLVSNDPSTIDVTAHVLSALSQLGYTAKSELVQKALEWLKLNQTQEGAWWGRWGLCYTYSTWAVLQCSADLQIHAEEPHVRKAVDWLKHHQNPDGGWGESYLAYHDPGHAGIGPSTAEQTSWGILGLLAANEDVDSEPIKRGVEYLLKTQRPEDGRWKPSFAGAALSPVMYEIDAVIYPLLALARYQNKLKSLET